MESGWSWRRFFSELKRRRVYRVATVYAATAFVVVQAADLTFERLTLPPWTVTLVIVLALLGFPVALVLAWAFEITPDGVRRTEPAPTSAAPEPVHLRTLLGLVGGLVLLGAGGWWLQGMGEGAEAAVDRLAVLPLANLMDDPEQDYFVQGMHNELIAELQQAGVPVIARTSVLRYGDGETPAREIARELDVDALVEGAVWRAGDSVDIDARIVDPETEEYLWSASFRESLRDVEALQRGLTRAIADEIHAALAPEDEARLANAAPVEPQAYDAYLRGVMHSQRFTPEDLETALGYFEQALAIDSTYAPAHLGIARVWLFRAQAGLVPAPDAQAHARPAVERARELGGDLGRQPMAATGAGVMTWGEWKFEEAEAAFLRAIELNGEHPETRIFYSHLLTILGRWDEAREQADRALELDPLNPFIQGLYGTQLVLVRRYGPAVDVLEEMFRRNPGAGFGRMPLAAAYLLTGRRDEVLRVLKDAAELRGDRDVLAALERGGRREGFRARLLRAADTLAARPEGRHRPRVRVANFYMWAGEEDEAVRWLEKAFESHDQNLPYMGVRPTFEPLHDRPRFRELARKVGVPILTAPRER